MKHRATLTVIFGVIAVACFFFVTELNGSSYEVMGFTFFGSIMLIWANFVAGESWLTEKGTGCGAISGFQKSVVFAGIFSEIFMGESKRKHFFRVKRLLFLSGAQSDSGSRSFIIWDL